MPVGSINADAAAVFAGTAVVIFAKGAVLSYLQVRTRFRGRSFERAEDARLMGVAVGREPEVVNRIAGAWRNEHENTPPFMAMSAGYVMTGGSARALLLVSVVYVMARIFQSYAQIRALQPHRTFAFLLGLVASLVLAGITAGRIWSWLS